MNNYDPAVAPDPQVWLQLDEGERLLRVSDFHDEIDDMADAEPSARQIHAVIHVVVENQLAEAWPPAVEAMARLRGEGLSRHDAVHAIGSVLAEHLWAVLQGGEPPPGSIRDYEQGLRALSVQSWQEDYGDPDR